MFTESSDPIPGAVRQLVRLFEDELSEVVFPDVGLPSLSRHISQVQSQSEQVQALETQLAAVRQSLDDRRRELTRHAEQAVAYIRVFATGRPELREKLESIELGRPPSPAPGKRGRGRPRRSDQETDAPAAELPLALESAKLESAKLESAKLESDNTESDNMESDNTESNHTESNNTESAPPSARSSKAPLRGNRRAPLKVAKS